MKSVFDIAEEQNARVILSGDIKQHSSVAAGDAFRILQQHADLKPVVIETIRRQAGDYRKAVDEISRGNVNTAFEILDFAEPGAVQQRRPEQAVKVDDVLADEVMDFRHRPCRR